MDIIAETLGLTMNLPTNPSDTPQNQSMQAGMYAAQNEPPGTFSYRWPVNMSHPTIRNTTRNEVAGRMTMPKDKGLYYFVEVRPGDAPAVPVLVREGEFIDLVRLHHALMKAQTHQLLSYTRPVDLRDTKFAAEILRTEFGKTVSIPGPGPHQYLVKVQERSILVRPQEVIRLICDLWTLHLGRHHKLLSFLGTVDFGQDHDRTVMREALGPDAALPWEGLRHDVILQSGHRELIPLGDAPAAVLNFALAIGHPHAGEFVYTKGLLPR